VPFDRILVPTDFSDDANAAARLAVALADRDGAEVVLLHISELPDYSFMAVEPIYLPQKAWQYLWEREAAQIESRLDHLRGDLVAASSGGARLSTQYHRANVVHAISDIASELACDLMVIGSQGEEASVRYLFGGHAPKIARDAPCAVLVARGDSPATVPSHALVAVDYSRFSAPAAAAASQLIGPSGRITCCHVWQQPPLISVEPYAEFAGAIEAARAFEARRMDSFVGDLEMADQVADRFVDIGSPARRILECAHERDADVIVLGSHSRTGFERVIGTVADRVLRHADLPVLFVPERSLEEARRAA